MISLTLPPGLSLNNKLKCEISEHKNIIFILNVLVLLTPHLTYAVSYTGHLELKVEQDLISAFMDYTAQ